MYSTILCLDLQLYDHDLKSNLHKLLSAITYTVGYLIVHKVRHGGTLFAMHNGIDALSDAFLGVKCVLVYKKLLIHDEIYVKRDRSL